MLERLVSKNDAQGTSQRVKWRSGARDIIISFSLFNPSETLEEDLLEWGNLPSGRGNLPSASGKLPSSLEKSKIFANIAFQRFMARNQCFDMSARPCRPWGKVAGGGVGGGAGGPLGALASLANPIRNDYLIFERA